MAKKGKVRYIPPSVWDEVEDIKKAENLVFHSEALRSMVKHSKIGREIERISKTTFPFLNFGNKKIKPKKKKVDIFL